MNPFLAGLVERATLRVPVLERRPRSLFEPVAQGGVAIEGVAPATPDRRDERDERDERDGRDGRMAPVEHEASSGALHRGPVTGGDLGSRPARRESSAEPAPRDRGMPAVSALEVARLTRNEQGLAGAAVVHHGESEPAARIEVQRGELEPVARIVTTPATALRVPSPPAERRLPLVPPQVFAQSSLAGRAGDVRHSPARAQTALPAAPGFSTVTLSSSTADAPSATNARLVRSRAHIPADPALPAWMVRSHAGPRASQGNATVASPPAPVHVTIGRIEVRASAPAADRPPARRSPAGPRLSLDDYLNGRRRGSR